MRDKTRKSMKDNKKKSGESDIKKKKDTVRHLHALLLTNHHSANTAASFLGSDKDDI
jgi:hypothetical protein